MDYLSRLINQATALLTDRLPATDCLPTTFRSAFVKHIKITPAPADGCAHEKGLAVPLSAQECRDNAAKCESMADGLGSEDPKLRETAA